MIDLVYFNGRGSIWNVKDWRSLRKLKITGTFIGCLANIPFQVGQGGLPLQLTKNETTLLLDKGFARLVDMRTLNQMPSSHIRDLNSCHLQQSFSAQDSLMREERRKEILELSDLIVHGKLARSDSSTINFEDEKQKILDEEIRKIPVPLEKHKFIEIPTEDPFPNEGREVPWTYPSTEEESLEYATFRHFWEEGYFVTPGGKFGGHLLVYPGDPLLTHAMFIVHCVPRHQNIDAPRLVALARLAHSVRKTAVLASSHNGLVSFQSLSWSNER